VAGSSEGIEGKVGGVVDERAWDRGDRNAAVDCAVSAVDPRAADADARHAPLHRRGHFRRRDRAVEQAEQVGGRAATQPCFIAARKHRGEIGRLDARRQVSDPIDAAVHAQQRTEEEAMLDLVARQSGVEELRARHETVLERRQSRDHRLHRGRFCRHRRN
jgi:hypothetical protein